MSRNNEHSIHMRETFEECGHTLSLLIDLCTSDVQLTQRSKLALTAYGRDRMKSFENAEGMLRDYADTSAN